MKVRRRTLSASIALLATAGSIALSTADANAAITFVGPKNPVSAYGCTGALYVYGRQALAMMESGTCDVSIDQTNYITKGWVKAGGWFPYTGYTPAVAYNDGVHAVTVCITPHYGDHTYETCGPLLYN